MQSSNTFHSQMVPIASPIRTNSFSLKWIGRPSPCSRSALMTLLANRRLSRLLGVGNLHEFADAKPQGVRRRSSRTRVAEVHVGHGLILLCVCPMGLGR